MLADLNQPVQPAFRLHVDDSAWNTHEQVVRVQQILRQEPPAQAALIASRIQMPRVAALLEPADASVLLVSSRLDQELNETGVWRFVPSYGALLASRDAIYEHAALIYYRWQGVIR